MITRPRVKVLLRKVLLPALASLLVAAAVSGFAAERQHGGDFAPWPNDETMPDDSFVFARLRYSSAGWRGTNAWRTDWPDSERNFSFRLQQTTSMKVNAEPVVIDIDEESLSRHPFTYIIEVGNLYLSDGEAQALRNYLLAGGFLMVDDFWGVREWNHFYAELKKIFPDREPVELALEHPIFREVLPLAKKPQISALEYALAGITYEKGGVNPDYRAILDDKGRIMMLICHNTDLGESWEWEGGNAEFFEKFSEKQGYPMGINIIVHATTN